jgi:hypothetical protein
MKISLGKIIRVVIAHSWTSVASKVVCGDFRAFLECWCQQSKETGNPKRSKDRHA